MDHGAHCSIYCYCGKGQWKPGRWFAIVLCWCGAEIVNGHHCVNGHIQNR